MSSLVEEQSYHRLVLVTPFDITRPHGPMISSLGPKQEILGALEPRSTNWRDRVKEEGVLL